MKPLEIEEEPIFEKHIIPFIFTVAIIAALITIFR